jgi:methyl-accepting chemotaxis protein
MNETLPMLLFVDRLLPLTVREDREELRRGRVFLAIWFLLTMAAYFFALETLRTGGELMLNGWILVIGGTVSLLNLPLAHLVRGVRLPSWLICLELIIVVTAVGAAGSGIMDASQWFLLLTPLVSSFLLGPLAGVLFTSLAGACAIGLWLAMALFDVDFAPPDRNAAWFEMLGCTFVLGISMAIAWVYETSRNNTTALVARAMKELQGKNHELEQLAQKLADARDRALEENTRKSEFLLRMRTFGETQGEAIARTHEATARLTQTIHSIAQFVDTLASSSSASDTTVAGMADSAGAVSQAVQGLVSGVEDTSVALRDLTGAVASVQGQYDQLRRSAETTAAAMVAMEESAARVEERAARTVELSDAMITTAERGQEAVRRTIAGVDDIRASARMAGDVIRELDLRVTAIGNINSVIDEVAAETNVLALNASIIAAQAGEKGSGFAVVADQIKGLAQRTSLSTREISAAIHDVQREAKNAVETIRAGERAVGAGVMLSEEAARALEEIVASARLATEQVRAIEQATVEQVRHARNVGSAMKNVTRFVGEAFKATSEHGRAAGQIESALARLRGLGPGLEQKSRAQADGAREARAAIARISEMARNLSLTITDQTRASDQTLRAVEEIRGAQRGQDEALRSL